MKAFRFTFFTAMAIISVACAKNEDILDSEPVSLQEPTSTTSKNIKFDTKSMFYQSESVVDALSLVPRESDGLWMLGFNTDYSSVNCRYPAPDVRSSQPYQTVTMETVPGGQNEMHFLFEIPATVASSLPEVFLEIDALRFDGIFSLSITLAPDFPFTKAYIENATITLPFWIDSENYSPIPDHRTIWQNCSILPGQVTSFKFLSEQGFTLQDNDGIRGDNHQLVIDGTIVVEGTLRVDEADRKDPSGKATPWSAAFFTGWETGGQIAYVTGKMNLDQHLKDRSISYSELPAIFKMKGSVFDLDELYGEVWVKNEMATPVNVSGILMGDEREYPFGSENGRTPVWVPDGNGAFHILFSEKGGRVKDNGQYPDRIDLPTPGFAGLLDEDPVSFALKDIRMKSDPQQSFRFLFDQDHWISVQGRISSPMMIGKDFQFQTMAVLVEIPESKSTITKMNGSFHVMNSFPFDFDVRPVLYDREFNRLPARLEEFRIPADERKSPKDLTFEIDWESDNPVSARYLILDLTAHTGNGREGESLYQDQQLSIGEGSFTVY